MGGGGNDQDNKHNQKLQAVLLADSFLSTFQPITLDDKTPKVLCPLNNVTMLDYAIEYLAGAGVEELYIFCVSGGDAIESHVERKQGAGAGSRSASRGTGSGGGSGTRSSGLKIICVRDSSVTDAGGALRELYNMNYIKSDPFILMSGDVVSNADLGLAMKEHKARHKKDNAAIMTCLLKRVGGWDANVDASTCTDNNSNNSNSNNNTSDNEDEDNHENHSNHTTTNANVRVSPLQPLNEDLTVALAHPTQNSNNTHSRVLLYDTNPTTTTTELPTSFFQNTSSSIELYNNMIDTGLYICSPDVLAKFSDEWDYLQIKTFISNSVAEEEEGLQSKIYAKILSSSEYAARIYDFRTYHAISNDLLKRWCYPIVPDNLPSGYEKIYRYGIGRHMMYIEQKGKTKVGKNVTLKGPGMVGSHTKIHDGCIIQQCVIGNDCFVNRNVTLKSCHLWEKVVVEEGVKVVESILCHGCIIKKGAIVNKGCIIGKNCIIGENVILPEFTRVTACVEADDMFSDDSGDDDDDYDDDSDDYDEDKPRTTNEVKTDHHIIGKDGYGRVWIPTDDDYDDDDDIDEEEINLIEQMKSQSIGYDPTSMLTKRMTRQMEDDVLKDVDYGLDVEDEEGNMFSNDNYDDDMENNKNNDQFINGRQKGVDVVEELKSICLEFDFESPIDNLRIELNSFKFSQNATFSDCVSGVILAILEKLKLTSDVSAGKLVASFKKALHSWADLLEKFCRGIEEEVSVIKAVEIAATASNEDDDENNVIMREVLCREPSFRFIIQTLHGEDVISDEAILSWATMRKKGKQDSPVGKIFNQKTTQEFLAWVEEDDSSSSGSGSDDGSSSSGSDSD